MSDVIVILRHGETDWNAQNRFASHTDLELNAAGRAQAREAAEHLRDVNIDAIVSSPARRAKDTALACISNRAGRAPALRTDERLRELHFGPFEGQTAAEILSGPQASVFSRWRLGDLQEFPEGAETFAEAASRAEALFGALKTDYSGIVLVVTHGHIARILVARCVLGLPVERHRRLRLDNGKFGVVQFEDEIPRLVAFNISRVDSILGAGSGHGTVLHSQQENSGMPSGELRPSDPLLPGR